MIIFWVWWFVKVLAFFQVIQPKKNKNKKKHGDFLFVSTAHMTVCVLHLKSAYSFSIVLMTKNAAILKKWYRSKMIETQVTNAFLFWNTLIQVMNVKWSEWENSCLLTWCSNEMTRTAPAEIKTLDSGSFTFVFSWCCQQKHCRRVVAQGWNLVSSRRFFFVCLYLPPLLLHIAQNLSFGKVDKQNEVLWYFTIMPAVYRRLGWQHFALSTKKPHSLGFATCLGGDLYLHNLFFSNPVSALL